MDKYLLSRNADDLSFKFKGELNTLICMEIEAEILKEVENHKKKVIFDLADVDYIASSFIRLCGSVASIVGNQNFAISNVSKDIKKLMKKVGLYGVLNID